jgi:hypothetical protein
MPTRCAYGHIEEGSGLGLTERPLRRPISRTKAAVVSTSAPWWCGWTRRRMGRYSSMAVTFRGSV